MKKYTIAKDKILCKTITPVNSLKKAVFNKLKIWGGSTITIGFLTWEKNGIVIYPESWRIAWVCWVVKTYIQPYVGIELNFITDVSKGMECDVRITFDPDVGSYSLIGTDCLDKKSGVVGESTNIGWIDAPDNFKFTYQGQEYKIPPGASNLTGGGGLKGGTILHEFGHILGMIHEHQNPFGIPFHWNKEEIIKIFSGAPNYWDQETITENFFIEYEDVGVYNGSKFDPNSIMKYSFGDGIQILDRNKYDTFDKYIIAVEYLERISVTLSPLDKYWLQQNYPGGKSPIMDNPPDDTEYNHNISIFKKIEFYIRTLDDQTRKNIILGMILIIVVLFIHDFYYFFRRVL